MMKTIDTTKLATVTGGCKCHGLINICGNSNANSGIQTAKSSTTPKK